MIFRVVFKTPNTLDYALEDLSEEERKEAEAFAIGFIEYDEILQVEFDTEKKTARVVPIQCK